MSEQCDHSNLQRRNWLKSMSANYFSPKPKLILETCSTISKTFDTSWLTVHTTNDDTRTRYETLEGLPQSKCIRNEVINVFRPEPLKCTLDSSIAMQLFMNTYTEVCIPLDTVIIEKDKVVWYRPKELTIPLHVYLMQNPSKFDMCKTQCDQLVQSLIVSNVRFPLLTLDMFEVNLKDETVRISDARLMFSQEPKVMWILTKQLLQSDARWTASSMDTDKSFVESQWTALKTII